MTVSRHGLAISRFTRPFVVASIPPISGSRSVQTSDSAVEQRAWRLAAVGRCKPAGQPAQNHYLTVFAAKYLKLHGKMARHITRFKNGGFNPLKMNAAFDQH
ncbi:hypothetical protein [Novosphingobium acidiphilum]|uniref:hypothetical protein n=1 Tax=Novosphingobium acidiphilum TaxID=505248 RepID=UPI0012EBB230|nr:hypothetical protein [Novosphingobium acidiphilum]